jgi:hypothetical protein
MFRFTVGLFVVDGTTWATPTDGPTRNVPGTNVAEASVALSKRTPTMTQGAATRHGRPLDVRVPELTVLPGGIPTEAALI